MAGHEFFSIDTRTDALPLSPETWSGWTAAALESARTRNVPVLLFVGLPWSTPSREAAAALSAHAELDGWLREHVVAIGIDAAERPDLAERYALGALPVVQFLTPDGDPLASVDDVAPEAIRAAGEALLDAWGSDRDDLLQGVESERVMRAAERATAVARRSPGMLTPAMLDTGMEILDGVDVASLTAAKTAGAIRLWRYAHLRRGTPGALERAREALQALFEAATTADGMIAVPHAPGDRGLALADQAAVLLALSELAVADDDAFEDLHERAAGLVRFVLDVLSEPYGGLREAALEVDPGATTGRVIAGSSAAAARSLLYAGAVFGEREWVERGRRSVDFLLERLRAGEAGFYHRWDGAAGGFGYLGDQAAVMLALLQAYEVSGAGLYLEHAQRLMRIVERDWREPGRGFRDLSELSESELTEQGGLLTEMQLPLRENVAMAEALLWLARLTHDEHPLDAAVDTLAMFATGLEQRGVAGLEYVRTVDRLLSAEPEIKVVAEQPPGEPDRVADPLMEAALRLPVAGRTVQRLTLDADVDLMRQLGLPRDAGRAAYVCIGAACSPPIVQAEQLLAAAEEMIESPVG